MLLTNPVNLVVSRSVRICLQDGAPVVGMQLADSIPIRGSALNASPAWLNNVTLTPLAGSEVQLRIAMTDARLFAVRIGCV